MKHIVLTGGGTAGHVTPNIALIPRLQELGYQISYIGSYNGIEKKLIEEMNIPYYGISSGKLRRYFDLKNFTDPFRVLKGFSEARKLLKHLKPDVVFSKGGFVTVPVVIAAKRCKIPAIIHESDMTPGLANKLCIPSAAKVCCNFPETVKSLPADKAVLTGTPIRQELLSGDKEADRLLGEQFLKEAEEAEARIFAAAGGNPWKNKEKESPEKKKAGYERLIAHLKATGKYRDESNYEEVLWSRRMKKIRHEFRIAREKREKEHERMQTAGIVAAIVFVLLIAGMTAQTNPEPFKETMIQVFGSGNTADVAENTADQAIIPE